MGFNRDDDIEMYGVYTVLVWNLNGAATDFLLLLLNEYEKKGVDAIFIIRVKNEGGMEREKKRID